MQMRPKRQRNSSGDGQFKDYSYNRIATRRVTAELRTFRLNVELFGEGDEL